MNNYSGGGTSTYQYDPQMTGGAGGMGVGSPVGHNPAKRVSVGDELDRNGQALSALHVIISEIEQRLEVLCAPRPPAMDTPGNKAESIGSQIVTALRASGYQIDSASARLQSLMGRLEL